MAEVQTESHKLNDESKGNRDPNGDQKDNQMSVKDGQPQKLRRFSFQLMAIDSSLPPSGLVLTTSSNDRVRDLRSIQKQLSEVKRIMSRSFSGVYMCMYDCYTL